MCYVPKTIIYNTKNMAWCNENNKNDGTSNSSAPTVYEKSESNHMKTCPCCGHQIQYWQDQQAGINDLPGLPAGVKFDPSDQEILEHLEGKVRSDVHKHHPLIDEFIHTIDGDEGICYTHPEKLPGVSKDGLIRHYFHRPSKAYMTGTRKRRKVQTDEDGSETRWHKTGKTRPIFIGGQLKGHKKILVLYSNYGKQRKPEKTNWVMHQYHLGNSEEEKDGELVVSKVFYQTQPRQSGSGVNDLLPINSKGLTGCDSLNNPGLEYYTTSIVTYDQGGHARASRSQLVPNFIVHHSDGSSFLPSQCCVKESG